MQTWVVKTDVRRKGVAYIFALLLLAIMTTLAIGMGSSVNLVLQRPENSQLSLSTQLAAESGVSFLRYHISQPLIAGTTRGSSLMQIVANHLADQLNASPCIMSGAVSYDSLNNEVNVPNIELDDNRWFNANLSMVSERVVRLKVTGYKTVGDSSISRSCSIDMEPFGRAGVIFQNGIVTNGRFVLQGNGRIEGLHNNAEANILCAGSQLDALVDIAGSCEVLGSIFIQDPTQYIELKGNIRVGDDYYHSQTITAEDIDNNPAEYESMLIGTEPVEFPEMDPSVFEPFAVNIIDASTDLSGISDFTNIRIKANTNPHFSGDFSIYGVIYIEQPNQVFFTGNVNIYGVIVTEQATDPTLNSIDFNGSQTLNGVDSLPDTAEFAALKELEGTFLMAPGFHTSFSGNVANVGGTMASETFTFSGNTDMLVKGSIISYGQEDFNLLGNGFVTFDKESTPDIPAGFTIPGNFGEVENSYREY